MKIKEPNFYSVIIGTEILNGRRKDAHFEFINRELLERGFEQKASFTVKDDRKLILDTFNLIKQDENSVLFSFGGIGATPDDLTRELSAKAFSDGELVLNQEAKEIIEDRLGERAYPHPIKMAYLPKGAKLIDNPVNKMPGFYLEERFFFVPGFPEMAHPMVRDILDRFYPKASTKYSCSFMVEGSESQMIDIMELLPDSIEFSSLPMMDGDRRFTEIRLAGSDRDEVKKWCEFFLAEVEKIGLRVFDLKTV